MKWHYYPLPDGDPTAIEHFFTSFSVGASDHALSRGLTERFRNATGPIFAIAMESLDLDRITAYRWAGTYSGGKQRHEVRGSFTVPVGERSIDGLAHFLDNYLRSSERTLVLCENWINTRSEMPNLLMRESRTVFYGEEVYHLLSSTDAGKLDFIATTVWEADNQWLTGICSTCNDVPQTEITTEAFFDEIVANLDHIFVSAFDGEGYLVWSPSLSGRAR